MAALERQPGAQQQGLPNRTSTWRRFCSSCPLSTEHGSPHKPSAFIRDAFHRRHVAGAMTAVDYEAEGLRERAETAAAGKEMRLEDDSVPGANVFGTTFRQYDSALSERQKQVERFYKTNHELQTMAFVQQQVQLP
jgi:hypothetical protein